VNAGQPCIGVTIEKRPVRNSRDYPDLPADFYTFSGLFGQRVTVFPTQDLVIVRTGQDPGLIPAGQASWEHELYTRVLGSITDQKWEPPGEAPRVNEEREDVDYGFQTAFSEPDQYSKGAVQDPLPAAGPMRARATVFGTAVRRVRRRGVVRVALACPPQWPSPELSACVGRAKLKGATARRYEIAAGETKRLRFRLSKKARRKLRRRGSLALGASARNVDAAGGTVSRATIPVS